MSMEFPVVNPEGRLVPTTVIKKRPAAPRLSDLNGKTVGEVWNGGFRGEVLFPAIREQLKKRYPDVKIIPYDEFPLMLVHSPDIDAVKAQVKKEIERRECDAVISGVGG